MHPLTYSACALTVLGGALLPRPPLARAAPATPDACPSSSGIHAETSGMALQDWYARYDPSRPKIDKVSQRRQTF